MSDTVTRLAAGADPEAGIDISLDRSNSPPSCRQTRGQAFCGAACRPQWPVIGFRFGPIQICGNDMAKAGGGALMAMGMLLLAGAFQAGAADRPIGDAAARAVASVDPFIGTGGEGHTFPGAVVPFGMVQLSPDTRIQPRKDAYDWAAGYRHDDSTIVGFSHTHFSGTGHSDLGDVLLMPIAGAMRIERGDADKPGSGYTSRFRHDDERAEPGYNAVTLDDYGVRAELTA